MSEIFISYRRADSGADVRLLLDRLTARYGPASVFVDVGSPAPGSDYRLRIQEQIKACRHFLAVIGPNWASAVDDDGRRRLDDDRDVVRVEIETALASGDLHLIPVLVGGARMPAEAELPLSLARLGVREAVTLRHEHYDDDFRGLLRALEGQPAGVVAPKIWNLRSPVTTFTARDEEIAELHQGFAAADRRIVAQALCGPGGVGKTQLALAYADRYEGGYDLGWWLSAADDSTTRAALAQLAGRLGIAAGDDNQERQAKDGVAALAGEGRFLLVFDGARDPSHVEAWLPHEGRGDVLITSLRRDWSQLGRVLPVGVLHRQAARRLLSDRALESDATAADALAQELGDLPLALEHAAAYLEKTGMSFEAYLARYRRYREQQDAELGYEASVYSTWEMSIDNLAPTGIQLLHVCAFLAPTRIPLDLFTRAERLPEPLGSAVEETGLGGVEDAAGTCYALSLLEREPGAVRVHRLVQEAIRHTLTEGGRRAAAETAIALLDAAFPETIEDLALADTALWGRRDELVTHIRTAAGHGQSLGVVPAITAPLLRRAGSYLDARGDYAGARQLLERALELAEAAQGPDGANVAEVLRALGYVFVRQHELDGARRAYDRALAITMAHPGPYGEEDRARILNVRGRVRHLAGDRAGARADLESALHHSRHALGPGHPEVASALNNLGLLLYDEHDLKGALRAHERAFAIKEKAKGPTDRDVGSTLDHIGRILRDEGDLDGARECLERALSIKINALGPKHPEVAGTRELLSSLA